MAGLVNVVKWQVPVKNHDDMIKLMSGGIERDGRGIDEQRWHPENILYSKTRTFYRVNEQDPEIEDWFFMDEYDDPELFKQQIEIWKNSTDTFSYAKEHHARWKRIAVPGSFDEKQVQFNEIEPLTINFEPFARRQRAMQRENDPWWRLPKEK